MAKEKFERNKPHVNVGTIGHVDHGQRQQVWMQSKLWIHIQHLALALGVPQVVIGLGELVGGHLAAFEDESRGMAHALQIAQEVAEGLIADGSVLLAREGRAFQKVGQESAFAVFSELLSGVFELAISGIGRFRHS